MSILFIFALKTNEEFVRFVRIQPILTSIASSKKRRFGESAIKLCFHNDSRLLCYPGFQLRPPGTHIKTKVFCIFFRTSNTGP
jgi:hypothetical protein